MLEDSGRELVAGIRDGCIQAGYRHIQRIATGPVTTPQAPIELGDWLTNDADARQPPRHRTPLPACPDHAVRPLPLQRRGNLFGLALIRNRLTPATETLLGSQTTTNNPASADRLILRRPYQTEASQGYGLQPW